MSDEEQQPPVTYITYNGLGRNPMLWGIPYMTGLAIMCFCLLGGLFLGTFVGGAGWLFVLTGVPIALFVKMICANDDKAVEILLVEVKWTIIRMLTRKRKYYGGNLAILPTTYGREKRNDIKRFFEDAIQRGKTAP